MLLRTDSSYRKTVVFLLLFCASLFSGLPRADNTLAKSKFYEVSPEPAWVVENSWQDETSKRRQQIQYLLIDDQLNIQGSTSTNYYRTVEKALSRRGVEQMSEFRIRFNPEYQTLKLHKLNVIRDGKASDRYKTVIIRELKEESNSDKSIYSGLKTALIIFDDIQVNDIIDLSYSLEGRNPILGERFFHYRDLGWTVSVDKQLISYLLPKHRALNYQSSNIELKPAITKEGDKVRYSWSNLNTKADRDDEGYPPGYNPFPWLTVSEYDSWEGVVDWALPLYDGKYTGGAEFKSLVSNLKQNTQSDKDYVEAALNFVQEDIRYLGLEFGTNSHLPRTPDETIKNRYGDCKDKAVLLTALLRANNISAWPVLVSSSDRGYIDQDLPAPGAFDHVISLVELDGPQYWLDGTRTHQGTDLNKLSVTNFGKGLVLRKGETALSNISPRSKSKATVYEEILATDYTGPVQLSFKTVYEGDQAEWFRRSYENPDLSRLSDDYLDYYTRFFPSIELWEEVQIEDDRENNILTVTEQYLVQEYWDIDGKMRVAPFFTTGFYDYTVKSKRARRNGPYWPGRKVELEHIAILKFPGAVDLDVSGWNEQIANRYFDYQTDAAYLDATDTLRIYSSFTIEGVAVPAEEVAAFNKDMVKVLDELDYTLRFDDPLQTLVSRRNSLFDRIDDILMSPADTGSL